MMSLFILVLLITAIQIALSKPYKMFNSQLNLPLNLQIIFIIIFGMLVLISYVEIGILRLSF